MIYLEVFLLSIGVLIDALRRFKNCKCSMVQESIPSHFMMKVLVALNAIFYLSKLLRIIVSFIAIENQGLNDVLITTESCPTTDLKNTPSVTIASYIAIAFSIFSQVSLICVLNIILDNASISSTQNYADSQMQQNETRNSNVPYYELEDSSDASSKLSDEI